MITIQKANTILKSTTRILPPTPRTLFRNGEEGAIIDASRAETVFADAGTTPASYGGSVALVLNELDALTFGPEIVENGDFSAGTANWSTATVSDGELVLSLDGNQNSSQVIPTIPALAFVQIRLRFRSTGAAVIPRVVLSTGSITDNAQVMYSPAAASYGSYTEVALTVQNNSIAKTRLWLREQTGVSGRTLFIDSISLRVIEGFPNTHAWQNSSSLRPLLGRAPVAGVRNLFTNTGFEGATSGTPGSAPTGWPFVISNGTQTVAAGGGSLGGNSIRIAVTLDRHFYQRSSSLPDNQTRTFSFDVTCISGTVLAQIVTLMGTNTGITQQFRVNGVVREGNYTLPAGDATIELIITTTTGHSSNQLRLGIGTSSNTSGEIVFRNPQLEDGSTATPYQRVGASVLDVTEAGLPAPGYLRFDLTDDRLVHTFPSGFDGDILIFGRSGSWVQEGVSVAAGGTLTIGPSTVPGAPAGSLLAALGDIVGWLPVGRTTTQAERNKMRDYYMARGAKGFLVPGPEQVPNGTFDTDISGWSDISLGTGSIAWDDGTLRTSSTDASNRGTARRDIPALITGRYYLASVDIVSADGPYTFRSALNGVQDTLFRRDSSAAPNTLQVIFLKPTGTFGLVLTGSNSGNARFDNASVRELRPEEDW
jgi:hypothetical protein